MNIIKVKIKSILTNWFTYLVILIVLSFSILVPQLIYQKTKNDLYRNKEESALNSGRILTRYLVDTFEMYHDSGTLKFKEVVSNLNNLTTQFSDFQIISVDGKVLVDSQDKNYIKSGETISDLNQTILAKSETYVIRNNDKVKSIVVPHFDDWGNHQYSVKYIVNYADTTQKLSSFRLLMFFVGLGIILVTFFVLILFHSGEKYKLEKEKAAELSRINKLKTDFINMVAHNLRTPLTIIEGYMSYLEEMKNHQDEKKTMSYLNSMDNGITRLSKIIEEIILATSIINDHNKISTEHLELSVIIQKLREKFDKEIKLKDLNVEIKLVQGTIMADKKLASLILENLFENAIKFNQPKGSIIIEERVVGAMSEISFTDTGIGMPQDKQASVFEKFTRETDLYRYQYEGIGLGLYLAKLAIDSMGGKIWFESQEGKGSKFSVSFPQTTI